MDRHGLQEELQIFLGVAKGLLLIEQKRRIIGLGAGFFRHFGQIFELVLRGLQPFLVRLGAGQTLLDLFILDDAALLQINQQHLAGLEPPFALDALLGHRQHAGFRSQNHMVVIGDDVAGGTKPVAVQGGADLAAVSEGNGGGTIPRLHQGCVVLVESLALGIHQFVAGPGFGDQHHHRMGQG